MKELRFVKVLLTLIFTASISFSQSNNVCSSSIALCPGVPVTSNNYNATVSTCPSCEDNFSLCFTPFNTVWFSFITNATGGIVTVDISALTIIAQASKGNEIQACIFSALAPCDGTTYLLESNCITNATSNFSLTSAVLLPSTKYYIAINGAKNGGAAFPAEASFSIVAYGAGVDRPTAGISIGGPSGEICPQSPQTIAAYLANCPNHSAFTWNVNTILTAVDTSIYFSTSLLQNGDMLSVSCNCYTDCPVNILANFGPILVNNISVNAGIDQTINTNENAILSGTSNGITFAWTPATTINQPDQLNTFALVSQTTEYTLTAANATCTISDKVKISVKDNLTVPGSFSPNNDGINDTWVIEGLENYPNATIQITNRWGNVLAEISGYTAEKAWNGTFKKDDVPFGVYFYSIQFNDGIKAPLKGFVSVIR